MIATTSKIIFDVFFNASKNVFCKENLNISTCNYEDNSQLQRLENRERGNIINHRELEQAYANLVSENKKLTQEIKRLHTMIKDNINNPVYISGPDGKLIAVTPDNMRILVDEIVKLQSDNKQVFNAISYNK